MKNKVIILFVVILLGVSLLVSPNKAQASSPAEGNWNVGKEVKIDLDKNPAPYSWVELLTEGVQVDKKGEICHPFRGAQFHWVPEIRRLVNGKWIKLETSIKRIPDNEGAYWACAKAPAAGTYAIFGYYNGPREYPSAACSLSMEGWNADRYGSTLRLYVDNLDTGTMIHFKQLTTDSHVTLTSTEGDVPVQTIESSFAELTTISQLGEWEIQIEISTQGCSRVFTYHGGAD